LFDSELFSDVVVISDADGTRFNGHKCVLATCSDVFKKMLLTEGVKETVTGEIRIREMSTDVICAMFKFIYYGKAYFIAFVLKITKHSSRSLTNCPRKRGLDCLVQLISIKLTRSRFLFFISFFNKSVHNIKYLKT
jgi:hypothetical protein